MDDFIKAFPDSQHYFNARLLDQLKAEIDGLPTDEMPAKTTLRLLAYVLKRVDGSEKKISSNIKEMLWAIIIKHPYIYYVNSRNIEKSRINETLDV